MLGKLKALLRSGAPLLALCLINYLTFRRHYSGRVTFPWDFLGGYHAQAFGWYGTRSVFQPPTWLPWSDMGFPAFLAIQSGAWYAPLVALHVAGIIYTVHVATVIQALHVLFGALGIYALMRRMGFDVVVALIGAIAYHFSSSFYSNQQHVDIIRAAAWLPWLLFSLHPKAYSKKKWGVLIAAFVLSQLLVAGYPGNIVSAVYGSAIWVIVLAAGKGGGAECRRYLGAVALAVSAGTLMAMPKWLPLALNGGSGIRMDNVMPVPMAASHLLTFLMPYDVSVLGGDVTMRSLWLPLAVFWGIGFADFRDHSLKLGLGLVALGVFMGMLVPHVNLLSRLLPGMLISRFPISDWRPVTHIGLVVASCCGWAQLLANPYRTASTAIRSIAMLMVCMAVVLASIKYGYESSSLTLVLLFSLVMMSLTIGLSALWPLRMRPRRLIITVSALVVSATALDGYWYYRSQQSTWNVSWAQGMELQTFGGRFSDFVATRRPDVPVSRRPARYVLGTTPAEALTMHNSSFYNRCWYMRSYCTFGYNNLRMSEPHRNFLDAVAGPGGDALLGFASRPQQLLFLDVSTTDVVPPMLREDEDASSIGMKKWGAVDFVGYETDSVTYRITVHRDMRVIENEIWWPGWNIRFCNDKGCTEDLPTEPTSQSLRSWKIKAGTWMVKLHFIGPPTTPGYVCFLLGLLLAILPGLWTRVSGLVTLERNPLIAKISDS